MPSLSSDARFFGLDLHDLARQLREPWDGASTWPVFSWLNPVTPVWLVQADGRDALWADGQRTYASPTASASAGAAAFTAIEVPEDLLLRRSVRLPAMGAADHASALALEARTASPFASDDLVWGAASPASAGSPLSLVLASRKQLLAYQSTLGNRVPAGSVPEFWVFEAPDRPLVLGGFGEARRLAFAARRRRTGLVLLASAVAIACLIALTPSLQLKLRANEARAAYAALAASAAPAIARREALLRAADQTTALQQRLADRIEPLRLLDVLTRILPDDTALQSLQLVGTKVTVTGFTANASTLMQLLGNQPGFRDVRAPGAATRVPGAEKEAFTIEFTADPAQLGVRVASRVPAAAPSPVVAAPSQVPSVPAAVSVPASTTAPAPAPAPPAVARPAPGGAVFGGTSAKPAQPAPRPGAGGKP